MLKFTLDILHNNSQFFNDVCADITDQHNHVFYIFIIVHLLPKKKKTINYIVVNDCCIRIRNCKFITRVIHKYVFFLMYVLSFYF